MYVAQNVKVPFEHTHLNLKHETLELLELALCCLYL